MNIIFMICCLVLPRYTALLHSIRQNRIRN